MQKINNTNQPDNNPQLIWEIWGELLDFYTQQTFTAKQVAYEIGIDKTTVNRALHRLVQLKEVKCIGTDSWGVKLYQVLTKNQ